MPVPVPVIDRAGRVLMVQDVGCPYDMFVTCLDGHVRTGVTGIMRNGPGECLAMTLDRAGRPVILWTDDNGAYFSTADGA
ncbi:hypothetical protein [Nonomuraea fuscirosea]|uniref:hypothetical protein n=1 Tax=Nonomuraea fuscirosea TaxID=1291556 RepID=UPI003439D718